MLNKVKSGITGVYQKIYSFYLMTKDSQSIGHIFVILMLVITLFLSIIKIHGSSIGVYHNYLFGEGYEDKNLLLGKPRNIRSDEFLVQTPWIISQNHVHNSENNQFIGNGQNMFFSSNIPSSNWSSIFRPTTFLYFFADYDRAFAFQWNIKITSLIIASFLLIKKIVKINNYLSILTSFCIAFSPFFYWWYSQSAIEVVMYAFLIIYLVLLLIDFFIDNKIKKLIFVAPLIVYFAVCFLLTLYPPFQIPVIWGSIFIILGYLFNKIKLLSVKRFILLLFLLIFLFIISLSIFLFYLYEHKNYLEIIMNTVYPGRRISGGGGMDSIYFFNYIYNLLLNFDSRSVPPIMGGNQSEASNFFMIYIFSLPISTFHVVKTYIKSRKIDYLLLSMNIFLTLLTLYLFFPLPEIVEKIMLLDRTTVKRAIIGVGPFSYIFNFYFIFILIKKKTLNYKIVTIILSFIALLLYIRIGYIADKAINFFHNFYEIYLLSFIGFLLTLTFFYYKKLFLVLFFIFNFISSGLVNPVYKGLDIITKSELINKINNIEKDNLKSKWVVYDSIIWGNYLIANGIKTINSVHYYPQFEQWEVIDSENQYRNIYNRYAHVQFISLPYEKKLFILSNTDSFIVNLDPCDQKLKDLGVGFYLFQSKQNNISCLQYIDEIIYPNTSFYFYKRL